MSESDPNVWSGRALQEVFVEVAVAVLHQCIRSLIGAVLLRTIMDISSRAISLADRPQRAIWVTSVRTRRKDRTLHLVSSSRRPRQVKRINLATSLLAPHFSASVAVCVASTGSD